MILEKDISIIIKEYIEKNKDLVEDDRKNVKNKRKIEYDKNIVSNISNIMSYKSKKNNFRYRFLIEYDLKKGKKHKRALFIMKNPSMADNEFSDNTVNKVLKTMHRFGYSKVYITNLIPEYTSKPKEIHIKDISENMLGSNYEIISILSKEVTKVFVAWGNNNGIKKDFYDGIIRSVKKQLMEAIKDEKVYCYCYNITGQPRHPAIRWSIKKKEEKYQNWPK